MDRELEILETLEEELPFVEKLLQTEAGAKLFDCIQCGTCSGSCPTVEAWSANPRQLVRLLQLGRREEVLRPEVLYYCSQCYSCMVRCPMGIKLTELLIEVRRLAVREQKGPLEAHGALIKSIQNYDNPWMQPRAARDRWAKRLRPKIAPREQAEVLYYPGCTASYVAAVQDVAVSSAALLSRLGVDYAILGREEICCGSTALRIGETKLYSELAARNIDALNRSGARILVTSCAGCYGVIKGEYPKIAPLDLEVLHLSELVERRLQEVDPQWKGPELRVTYHDPCHLGRHGGVYDAPRSILRKIDNVELVEMERVRENSRCCGAGGGVRTAHGALAAEVASDRLQEALDTGAQALVTCCPFCEQNFSEGILASGTALQLYDLVQFVNAALG